MLRSDQAPLTLHLAADTEPARALRMLEALELAHALALEQGWPLPYPDGAAGGDGGFDLYAVVGAARAVDARADLPIHWADQDATASHALIDADVADADLDACALSALLQAGLLGQDPAEPAAFRRATAAYVQWATLGTIGCGPDADAAQARPEAGLLQPDDASVAATAWLLAAISRRHDGGSGRLLRELWQLSRQRSDTLEALRASPNLAEAIARALDNAGESLEWAAIDLAIERSRPSAAAAFGANVVAMTESRPYDALPQHLPHASPLAHFGSAYARVDTRTAKAGERLQVWLRGESGVRWSLTAVQLDGQGVELGRVSAPARRVPEAFLPVELSDGVAAVVLVVVALPPDRDAPLSTLASSDGHYFKLILDRDVL